MSSCSFFGRKRNISDDWFSFLFTAAEVVHLIRNMEVIVETPIIFLQIKLLLLQEIDCEDSWK